MTRDKTPRVFDCLVTCQLATLQSARVETNQPNEVPVCSLDFRTSGGIATIQLKIPAMPPANNVRPTLRSLRLDHRHRSHQTQQPD